MTEREILLKKISTYQFAAFDLQLFLDTHPYDRKTLEKMKEYKALAQPLVAEYEEKFGPLTKKYDKLKSLALDNGTLAVGK